MNPQMKFFKRSIDDEIHMHLKSNYIALMSLWTKAHRKDETRPPIAFYQKLATTYGYDIPLRVAEKIYTTGPEIESLTGYLIQACKQEAANDGDRITQ